MHVLFKGLLSLSPASTTLDKKKNHPRDSRWEERCSIVWYHARWRTINAGRKLRTVADDFALRWSCVIEHDITRSNSVLFRRESRGWFFFLSRVVHCIQFDCKHYLIVPAKLWDWCCQNLFPKSFTLTMWTKWVAHVADSVQKSELGGKKGYQNISLFHDVAFFRSKSSFFFFSLFWSALFWCSHCTVSGDPFDQVFIYLLGNPPNNNRRELDRKSSSRTVLDSQLWHWGS